MDCKSTATLTALCPIPTPSGNISLSLAACTRRFEIHFAHRTGSRQPKAFLLKSTVYPITSPLAALSALPTKMLRAESASGAGLLMAMPHSETAFSLTDGATGRMLAAGFASTVFEPSIRYESGVLLRPSASFPKARSN